MELLQRRKFCREFLNGYNEKLHPQIISKVFEIGLLTLKNRFNKLLFSNEELDEIIKDLSKKNYVEIVPLPPLKKLEKLPSSSQKIPPQQNHEFYLNTENNNENLIKTKILRNRQLYDKTLQNPNFTTQNSAIYPNWWWNNKEEEEIEPKRNINIVYNEQMNNDINNENNNYNYEYEENEADENCEYLQVNEGIENSPNYENYEKRQDFENTETKNKNYTIKKLTMNSTRPKRVNRYDNNENIEEEIYHQKSKNIPVKPKNIKAIKNTKKFKNKINKKEGMQRVKSSKPPSRKIHSFTKSNQAPKTRIIKNVGNVSQDKKNIKLTKIPKYKYTYVNGKILRIPEVEKKYMNLTMTEPNKH